MTATEHDHTDEPRVWCTRCQHEHIASIPATTYECDSCGFAQWDLGTARLHEAQQDGHRVYPIAHPTVPLDERPAAPAAAGVLHEVVTRIDEARYANGDTASPWDNIDVLGLLAHLRQPYTYGGAMAADTVLAVFPQPNPSAEPPIESCLSGDMHAAHEWGGHPGQPGTGYRCPGIAATPPRIADMAPGTTFTADLVDDRIDAPRLRRVWRVQEAPGVVWNDEQNFGVRERRIDPSTIGDVTPPTATPEGGADAGRVDAA